MKHDHFLSAVDDARVTAAITAAEAKTSGTVRVLISKRHSDDPVAAAAEHFHALGLDKRDDQNAVLIFVAPQSHTFAIYGGPGIHARVGTKAWSTLRDETGQHMRESRFTDALVHAIAQTGALLATHFPRAIAPPPK